MRGFGLCLAVVTAAVVSLVSCKKEPPAGPKLTVEIVSMVDGVELPPVSVGRGHPHSDQPWRPGAPPSFELSPSDTAVMVWGTAPDILVEKRLFRVDPTQNQKVTVRAIPLAHSPAPPKPLGLAVLLMERKIQVALRSGAGEPRYQDVALKYVAPDEGHSELPDLALALGKLAVEAKLSPHTPAALWYQPQMYSSPEFNLVGGGVAAIREPRFPDGSAMFALRSVHRVSRQQVPDVRVIMPESSPQ